MRDVKKKKIDQDAAVREVNEARGVGERGYKEMIETERNTIKRVWQGRGE